MYLQVGAAKCDLSFKEDHIYIYSLGTTPSERGKGWGALLIHQVKLIAKAHDKYIELYVGPWWMCPYSKEQLRGWYERQGFSLHRISEYGTIFMRYTP